MIQKLIAEIGKSQRLAILNVLKRTQGLSVNESAKKLYGPAAAEKLLFMVFQEKTEKYAARLKGATPGEKAESLARLRDGEGYMSQVETAQGLCVVEHHSPILDLLRAFPIVARL